MSVLLHYKFYELISNRYVIDSSKLSPSFIMSSPDDRLMRVDGSCCLLTVGIWIPPKSGKTAVDIWIECNEMMK